MGSFRDECGTAVVEFVFLAVLVMVPLFYLVMTLARVQAGAYAASTAAREAGRAYVTASSQGDADVRARAAARIAFADQGFDPGETGLRMACDGDPCLRPDGRIEVSATVRVALPLVPSFARAVVPLEVAVGATHVAVVDRFRGAP
ncbi:pilus assembly protein [Nostocoides sp. HKS02]|uniref:pilus assembly protein n=1 Tax=Nostocoides sp. HKS02 TaxID=1813880 RepID=UPI001E3132B4|nr:pilus assembly protein [Tetrasphaera sp. HKS02]